MSMLHSTRVRSLPSALKRTSNSVFRVGSYCQSALISHERTRRECGSHAITLPHWHVLPSSPRSNQRPLARECDCEETGDASSAPASLGIERMFGGHFVELDFGLDNVRFSLSRGKSFRCM